MSPQHRGRGIRGRRPPDRGAGRSVSSPAAARDADFDRFFAELLTALGFAANATLPVWWQGWPARTHVRRWIDDIGLSQKRIIAVAIETQADHPNPPDGPKALDRLQALADRVGDIAVRLHLADEHETSAAEVCTEASVAFARGSVTSDNVVNAAESTAGFSLTGTAEPGSRVVIKLGSANVAQTVATDGS